MLAFFKGKTPNNLKSAFAKATADKEGGDFMGLEDEVSRMISEGSPLSEGCDLTISPVREIVVVKNSRFPERVGRIRFDTALELVTTVSERPDWSLFNSAREMDDVTGR